MLLSGVVRNRKLALSSVVRTQRDTSDRQRLMSTDSADHGHSHSHDGNGDEYHAYSPFVLVRKYCGAFYGADGCTWDKLVGYLSPFNFRVSALVPAAVPL